MGILSFLFGANMSGSVFADSSKFEILDVRTPEEFEESHVIGATNIDFLNPSFTASIQKLDKNKIYKLYCRSGNRSGQAEILMKTLGFSDVENIGSLAQAAQRLQRETRPGKK